MNRSALWIVGFCLVFAFPSSLLAADSVAQADKLFDQGGLENIKKAIDLYKQAMAADPKDYEAAWKCARALREYGDTSKQKEVEGWKDICAKYGKEGMQAAEKAIALKPGRPDGHYYYGLSVGVYSDGVSIFTALKEGLKDKTQKSFERTYEINKMYNDGGPMISLGRFWALVPWPYRDRKESLKYYREYQQTKFFATNTEAQLYLAELLIQMGGKEKKTEARGYVEKAAQSDDPYFKSYAARLKSKLE